MRLNFRRLTHNPQDAASITKARRCAVGGPSFVQDFLHKRRPADNTSAGLLPMTNLSVPKEGVERTLLQAPPVIRQA